MSRCWTGPALLVCFLQSAVVFGAASGEERPASARHVLWYQAPARDWEKQALPIGNGRLGGMVFGAVDREHIQFNEDSLWIGDEKDTGAYQTFGDVYIEFDAAEPSGPVKDYRRTLDIGRAVHQIGYSRGGATYHRTYFSSQPAQVMVLRFTADKKAAHSGIITLTDGHKAKVVAAGNKITASGSLAGYVYPDGSTRGRKAAYDIALK